MSSAMLGNRHGRLSCLKKTLARRILLLDGALGTSLMRHLPDAPDCSVDSFNITGPAIVERVHRAYLNAGADILSTNTFNSQPLYLSSSQAVRQNIRGAGIARRVADEYTLLNPAQPRFVAGSMGPTWFALTAGDMEDKTAGFDKMHRAYAMQARCLIEGGVDFLLMETIFDKVNLRAANYGIKDAIRTTGIDIPVVYSSLPCFGNEILREIIAFSNHISVLAVGFNCFGAADDTEEAITKLNDVSPFPTIIYPSAGLPDAAGIYPVGPEAFVEAVQPLMLRGLVNIIGGCCGTTPAHISALAKVAADIVPRHRYH